MWESTKKEYVNEFKDNEDWIDFLDLLLNPFENEIAVYDPNDDSVNVDQLHKAVKTINKTMYFQPINIPLDGGGYICGSTGIYKKQRVLIYGYGDSFSSAETTIIVNQKDQAFFEKEFNLTV